MAWKTSELSLGNGLLRHHARIEELLEFIFSMLSILRLYDKSLWVNEPMMARRPGVAVESCKPATT
jgi:hypothetical protein